MTSDENHVEMMMIDIQFLLEVGKNNPKKGRTLLSELLKKYFVAGKNGGYVHQSPKAWGGQGESNLVPQVVRSMALTTRLRRS